MERKLTLLNKEIDSFFEKNFPLKKKVLKMKKIYLIIILQMKEI
jgi:hypothetical protein